MAELEIEAALSGARAAASAASFDVQKLPEDSLERQALHGIISAIDYLIQAVDAQD
ncbi:hypothetical protein [Glaciihabitans sp. dw_435]|uniref:hypothetical protein n=1 Tax=Glaciihabitans sp. dw_435 TaxID=2720081 RepID=UPI001BD4C0B1|nr:hypothetical protein [Glaciihabitans sp. dw_435]